MKYPATTFASLLLLSGALSRPALAQIVYAPVAVTGYNADVIANGARTTVASSTSATIDRGIVGVRWCFADSSWSSPTGGRPTLRALPTNGFFRSITTPGLTYRLGQAGSPNNSLRIDGAGSGTLTLVTPQSCSELEILATEGNGNTIGKTFVVNFTDGTTQTFAGVAVPDWFGNGANPAIVVHSRVNRDTDGIDNQTNDPTIYDVRLRLATANYSKLVASITVSKATTDPVLNVMGISLGSACLGAPAGGIATANIFPVTVCPGLPVTLALSGAAASSSITYQWQVSTDGGTTFTDIPGATTDPYTVRPTVTGQYRAKVMCQAFAGNPLTGLSRPITVTVLPAVATLAYATPPTYCPAGTATVVTATPAGGQFSSTVGLVLNATTGSVNLATSTIGTYTVTYAVTTPCPATASTTITIAPAPPFSYTSCAPFYKNGPNASPTLTTAAGGTFSAPAGLIVNPATGVVDLAASTVGIYTITYTTSSGCTSTASFEVAKELIFPNIITPNDDKLNDKLLFNLPNVTGYQMQVYNRWGRRVYENSDPAQGWTATDNGPGVYFYQVDYTDCTGQTQHYKGWVEVIK